MDHASLLRFELSGLANLVTGARCSWPERRSIDYRARCNGALPGPGRERDPCVSERALSDLCEWTTGCANESFGLVGEISFRFEGT